MLKGAVPTNTWACPLSAKNPRQELKLKARSSHHGHWKCYEYVHVLEILRWDGEVLCILSALI